MSKVDSLLAINPIIKCGNLLFSHFPLLEDLTNYFAGLACQGIPDSTKKLLFAIGTVAITYKVLMFLFRFYRRWRWLPTHLLNQRRVLPQHLKQKYGDCYVVITGCT
jgi:hypothetical protein